MSKKSEGPPRFTIIDRDRETRNKADALAELGIYGQNASDVVRTLVARAYMEHYGQQVANLELKDTRTGEAVLKKEFNE